MMMIQFSFVILQNNSMATPIQITPPLSGKQSRKFNEQLAVTSKKRISAEEKHRIFSLVEKVLSKQQSR
jgi:hypothetical protein